MSLWALCATRSLSPASFLSVALCNRHNSASFWRSVIHAQPAPGAAARQGGRQVRRRRACWGRQGMRLRPRRPHQTEAGAAPSLRQQRWRRRRSLSRQHQQKSAQRRLSAAAQENRGTKAWWKSGRRRRKVQGGGARQKGAARRPQLRLGAQRLSTQQRHRLHARVRFMQVILLCFQRLPSLLEKNLHLLT